MQQEENPATERKWHQLSIAFALIVTNLAAAGLGLHSRLTNNAKEELQVEKAKATIISQDPNELSNALEYLDNIDKETTFGTNKQLTLLKIAIQSGNIDLCKRLIEKGADVNTADALGVTPLHFAAASLNYIHNLLSQDDVKNPEILAEMDDAVKQYGKRKEIYDWLIENGADQTAKTNNGKTPEDILNMAWSYGPDQKVRIEGILTNAQSQSQSQSTSRNR